MCELDAGRPKAQVPRFHMMAAINSANTIAKPALLPTCRINSTGNSEMMPKATAPEDVSTPARLNIARPDDREIRRQRARIDDGRHRVRGIVKAVHELESERDQERDEEQEERHELVILAPLSPTSV